MEKFLNDRIRSFSNFVKGGILKVWNKIRNFDKKLLCNYFDRNSEIVIVDAGAYDGKDAIEFRKIFPKAKIFAFEADPGNYEMLEENCKGYNIKLSTLAVSGFVGTQSFYPCKEKGESWHRSAGSLLEPLSHKKIFPHVKFTDKPIDVKTITLHRWAEKQNIRRIDFLWMDVQGAELLVLKGAKDLDIKMIFTEIEYKELYKNQPLCEEVHNFLTKQGFILKKEYRRHATFGNRWYIKENFKRTG